MWGFSTEYNQPVRSSDDPNCLICPIGHKGWSEVNIRQATYHCWDNWAEIPDPRPDLEEYMDQTKAIHEFLGTPEAHMLLEKARIQRLTEKLRPGQNPSRVSYQSRKPIHFLRGHVNLTWTRG